MHKTLAGLFIGLVLFLSNPIVNATSIQVIGDFSVGPGVFDMGTFSGSFAFQFDDSELAASISNTLENIPLDSLTLSPNYGAFDLSNVKGLVTEAGGGGVSRVFIGVLERGVNQLAVTRGEDDFVIGYSEAHALNVFTITQSGQAGLVNEPSEIPFTGSVSVTAVPIPAAFWLMGSGLLGFAGVVKRNKRTSRQ